MRLDMVQTIGSRRATSARGRPEEEEEEEEEEEGLTKLTQ